MNLVNRIRTSTVCVPPDCFMICVQFCTKQCSCKNKSYSRWGENTESQRNRFTRVLPPSWVCPVGLRGGTIKTWRLTVMTWEQSSRNQCHRELQQCVPLPGKAVILPSSCQIVLQGLVKVPFWGGLFPDCQFQALSTVCVGFPHSPCHSRNFILLCVII